MTIKRIKIKGDLFGVLNFTGAVLVWVTSYKANWFSDDPSENTKPVKEL
jgi:hypothetical protein